VIHKKTFLADSEWGEILAKALKGSPWGDRPLEDVVVKVFAAAKGEKDGKVWLLVVQLVDGSKPVIAIKHREGEIPTDERARVPGNNLAFFQNIGSGYGGVYEEHLGGFGWLCYDGELKRLGVKHSLNDARIWSQLLTKVCNRRGLECQKPAVLTLGDFWWCDDHVPASWPQHREGILKRIEEEAEKHEHTARMLASEEPEIEPTAHSVLVQSELHMAAALRKKHRFLSRKKCWTIKTPKEAAGAV